MLIILGLASQSNPIVGGGVNECGARWNDDQPELFKGKKSMRRRKKCIEQGHNIVQLLVVTSIQSQACLDI